MNPTPLIGLSLLAAALVAGEAPDWTGWRGSATSGAAADCGRTLVDPAETGLTELWVSEAVVPGTYECDARSGGDRHTSRTCSGYSSPVVAGGGVFLVYYLPNGPVHDAGVVERVVPKGGNGRHYWYTDADAVAICADAETGATRWKRVLVEDAWNLEAGFNKGGCQLTPAWHAGRLYANGPGGEIFCIDAQTGAMVWETDVGIRARYQDQLKDGSREQGRITGGRNDFGGCVMVIGGTVVISDHQEYKGGPRCITDRGNGLCGFAPDTGAVRWYLPQAGGRGMLGSTPLKWTHGGREFILACGNRGCCCVDPADGRVLWTEADAVFDNAAAVSGDLLVCPTAERGLGCFAVSDDGLELRWALKNRKQQSVGHASPVIYGDHVYALTKSGLLCIALADGAIAGRVKDQQHTTSSLAGGDGLLFAHASGRGKAGLNVYRMDPAGFRRLGETRPLPFANSTTAAYCDGRLYLRGRDRLHCYDLRAERP